MIRPTRRPSGLVAGLVCALLLGIGPVASANPPLPLFSPLSSIIPPRIRERSVEKETSVYGGPPGFGFSSPSGLRFTAPDAAETPSVRPGEHFLGGSLELASSYERLVPALYIEGEGYVPIEHPAIRPYLEPGRDRPETNPQIVMVPIYRLAGYADASDAASPARIVDASGPTLLSLPPMEDVEPIVVAAQSGWSKQTDEYDIFFLKGDCSIRQGRNAVQGPEAVVWITRNNDTTTGLREVTVYLESDSSDKPLHLEFDPENLDAKIYDKKWFGRLNTRTSVQTLIMTPEARGDREPAIYHRALAMMSRDYSVIRQAQFVSEASKPAPTNSPPPRYRRLTLNSRGDSPVDVRFDPYPNNPERGIVVVTKGLNLMIEGVTGEDLLQGDIVDISADHAVIWSSNPRNIRSGVEAKEDSSNDFEVYLEGNIIFRDGARTVEAHRMYYDAKNRIAYILDGRLSTPIVGIKGINGSLFVRAEILQQLGQGQIAAKNTLVTSSQLGEPSYSLRSRSITINERIGSTSWTDGAPKKRQILVGENNYLAMRNVPVFYWPWMAADLKDPTFYIKNIAYGTGSTYGNQIKTRWNPFQLLNLRNRPDWLDGDLFLSWSEKRGFGHGVELDYAPSSFGPISGPTRGYLQFWGINDQGSGDRLGGRRKNVPFPHQYRYRVLWRHRQEFDSLWKYGGNWTLSAQVGKTSDRNFLNHYSNSMWNEEDNATTSVRLKKTCESSTMALSAEYALDDFYTNSNWLPRFDHFALGKSLLNDRLTWYGHTRVGYVDYNTATEPYAPDYAAWQQDSRYFRYLPWELTTSSPTSAPYNPRYPNNPKAETIDCSFETFSTRHELDLPFNIGPVRCVPYVLGDFSHWGKNRSGNDVQRFYGQGGVRLNLPLWKIKPNCSSRTWYVNGLAHKIDFDAELSYARADHDMDDLILTDALDNWSIEDFRRRYSVTTFGANGSQIPMMFDPRYYALRSGLAGNVTAGNMELADDLTLCRFGMTHRFQTKRGPVGRRYIVDWITLSTHFNYYPESEQNFGESIGLIDYDFLWHVGDRFSLFSSGLYDLFADGQRITRFGGMWNRPERGNFGVMLDRLQGPIDRTYLTLNVGYTMNEKYSMTYTTSYDIKSKWKNVGHNFMFTRTGEAFRLMVGAIYNEAKDEWSFSFGIEPVFMRGIAKKMTNASRTLQNEMR